MDLDIENKVQNIKIKVQKINNYQWDYTWEDDLGSHRYILNLDDTDLKSISEPGSIKNIQSIQWSENKRVYSWKDNFGFHQYYTD